MYDAWCMMYDVWCMMYDVHKLMRMKQHHEKHSKSIKYFRKQIPEQADVGSEVSYLHSNIALLLLLSVNVKTRENSNISVRVRDKKLKSVAVRLFVMCDVWCVMCDVWCVMCEVWCLWNCYRKCIQIRLSHICPVTTKKKHFIHRSQRYCILLVSITTSAVDIDTSNEPNDKKECGHKRYTHKVVVYRNIKYDSIVKAESHPNSMNAKLNTLV